MAQRFGSVRAREEAIGIEHEVKLAFESVEAARQAVTAAGGRLVVSRRLLDDRLFDTADLQLRRKHSALRIRRDGTHARVTFKGAAQQTGVKSREEIETAVGDAAVAESLLESLGYQRRFRSEKYREEYALDAAVVTVDETPIGVFVEIEADPVDIGRISALFGRSSNDYILESYPRLYAQWCKDHGLEPADMTFEMVRGSQGPKVL